MKVKKQYIVVGIAIIVVVTGIGMGGYVYLQSQQSVDSKKSEMEKKQEAWAAGKEYVSEGGIVSAPPPSEGQIAANLDNQSFSGVVTVRTAALVTVRHEDGTEREFTLREGIDVRKNIESTEISLDEIQAGSSVGIGYKESTQEVTSIWLWIEE